MEVVDDQELDRRAQIAVADFGGIAPQYEVFYLYSLIYSSQKALDAYSRYEFITAKPSYPSMDAIGAIQEAIGYASSLSRFFWPSGIGGKKTSSNIRQLREARAEKLRNCFDLTDESPLKSRSLRDTWEHFDERLDRFLLLEGSGHFFPGPTIGDHSLADDPTIHIFKLLDPDHKCLVLLGNKYYFEPLMEEVKRVHQLVAEAAISGRLPGNDRRDGM